MAGKGAGEVEAKELDGPLTEGAGVISGTVPAAGVTGAREAYRWN